ncbi:type III pantothenate kinase [Pseudoalteromonas mariniglutinosa]|uniref:type III pantothenate kinase n=1 Tax=Pseudoalteromonas mariniglutinosa TaxID=206042 RepID=UPI00384C5154
MRLLIDVGNTVVKGALWQPEGILPSDLSNLPWQAIDEVIYACVGRSSLLEGILQQAAEHQVAIYEAKVTQQLAGVQCGYPIFKNLGIDRWLAIIASYTLWPKQSCIIVDAGTATTIDVLNASGEHLGGWILPGLDLMARSLTEHTQRVFDDQHIPFATALGCNTPNGLKNGALVATIGAIEQAKQHLVDDKLKIVCAGGYGKLLADALPASVFDSQLVFKGLNEWRNLTLKQ